jgi:hypothetical protein
MSILSPRTYWTAMPFGYEKLDGEKGAKSVWASNVDTHLKGPFYMGIGIQESRLIINS